MSSKYKDELGLIVMKNCENFGKSIDSKIMEKRQISESFIIPIEQVRFNNGEGKVVIKDSVRDKDLYILSDVGNHSETYKMFGYENHMSPDDHYQDIKRVISAIRGQADRISVVMPLLYESRQHRRKGRESLDCALALQELQSLGVSTIVTFDVHDPNIQNAVPNSMSFENFYPTNTILKEFIKNEDFDSSDVIFISPDTGAMDRARYYANMFQADVGMFHKRRDLSKIVDGKNPIVAHEYLGRNLTGKTAIVVDDMIASGGSMLDVANDLKQRGAKKVYLISTFAMFTNGFDKFNEAFKSGLFDKLYSTNLTYVDSEVTKMPWYKMVDCSTYASDIIDTLNSSGSISELKNGKQKIIEMLDKKEVRINILILFIL